MRDIRTISTAVIILIAAAGLSAQKLLLNQDYLNQFPAIERVRTAEKGIETATAYSTRTADEKKKKADRKVL